MQGIYFNMSFEEYQQAPGINQSGLKEFKRSAEHYYDKYLAEDRVRKETKAFRQGHLIHAAVLEPEIFDARYIRELNPLDFPNALRTADDLKAALIERGVEVKSKWNKAQLVEALIGFDPKLYELVWDNIVAIHARKVGNKEIISGTDWDLCQAIRRRVEKHPTAQFLRQYAKHEVSIFWTDEFTGATCKARLDTMLPNGILDTKTTDDASYDKFVKHTIPDYDYHIQAAWYLDALSAATGRLLPPESWIWEVFEKARPFGIAYYNADEEMIRQGRSEYRALLEQYVVCAAEQDWPGYSLEIKPAKLPKWKLLKGAINEF